MARHRVLGRRGGGVRFAGNRKQRRRAAVAAAPGADRTIHCKATAVRLGRRASRRRRVWHRHFSPSHPSVVSRFVLRRRALVVGVDTGWYVGSEHAAIEHDARYHPPSFRCSRKVTSCREPAGRTASAAAGSAVIQCPGTQLAGQLSAGTWAPQESPREDSVASRQKSLH